MNLKDMAKGVLKGKKQADKNIKDLKSGVNTDDAKRPKTPADIKLGSMVQDMVSGCFGTATSRHDMVSGNIQFGVQPVGDGVNYPTAWSFDWNQLAILSEHLSGQAVKAPEVHFGLGDKVRDKISGYEGIVTGKSTFLNGYVYAGVVSDKLNEKGEPTSQMISSQRIAVLVPAAEAQVVELPKGVKTNNDKDLAEQPGGPARQVQQVR